MIKHFKDIFREINDDIFNGQLNMPIFSAHVIDSAGEYWTRSIHHIDYVNINPIECNDYLGVFGTIAHEMCHISLYRLDGKHWNQSSKHSKWFKEIAQEIADFYNLPLDKIV